MSLELPEWLLDTKYSWLTEEYIAEHGKYPEKPDVFGALDENMRCVELPFSTIPLISTDDIEVGDILILFDGNGQDIFYRFSEDDIRKYRNKERGFLAHGVIVKPPHNGDEA